MRRDFKLSALILSAMMAGCTSESGLVQELVTEGGNNTIKLARSADISAFSSGIDINEIAMLNTGENYDYDFPTEMSELDEISIPGDAIDYSKGNFQNDFGSYVIKFTGGENDFTDYGWTNFGTNNLLTIYITGKVKIGKLGDTSKNGNRLFITEGAELIMDQNPTAGSWEIYNVGDLTINNGVGSNINNIYTYGNVTLGTDQWNPELRSSQSIYSNGGVIEFKQNENEYSTINIDGKIVCNNILKNNGHIKFQGAGYRDVCYLESTGLIEITNGTNIFGEIDGPNLKFDGAKVKLHPQGFVNIEDDITITNSGCAIIPDGIGLVKSTTLNVSNTGDAVRSIFPEGIYFNVSADKVTYNPDNVNGREDILNRINTQLTVTPACDSSVEEPDDPVVTPDPEDPDPEDPETPDTPDTPEFVIPDHVEVNLEVEEHKDYLATHLSIHVRAVTDVEVFIPIKAELYCAQDDMAIVEQHLEEFMVHGGYTTDNNVTYNVNGTTVTLKIAYEADGIRVTTDGINENVIDYLKTITGDGITFEVWNYYNEGEIDEEGNITGQAFGKSMDERRQNLYTYLYTNNATVEFLDKEPSLYVNAFFFDDNYVDGTWAGYNKDAKNPWDCEVKIVDEQVRDFKDYEEGWFYNDSEYNWLYWNNDYSVE